MEALIERLRGRLGARYALAFGGWLTIVAFATAAMTLTAAIPYVSASGRQLRLIGPLWAGTNVFALLCCAVMINRHVRGGFRWIRGERDPQLARDTWEDFSSRLFGMVVRGVLIFVTLSLPAEIVGARVLGLPWYGSVALIIGVVITTVVAGMLDYLGTELLARPMLREIARYLPADVEPERPSPALRWRLTLGMTITSLYGVLLGAAIASASFAPATKLVIGVSFAIILSGTLVLFIASLLSAAVLTPVTDIVRAMREVETGSLDARVPVLGADEVGFLARSFNRMMSGLAEREVLRSAMGAYVAPHVAERILAEGTVLEGEELDVTIMFLDIRDFTASADGQEPRQTVRSLNDFFGLVVPIVVEHGGHPNKFLGDGFLAVFGAPERSEDHADQAVAAAAAVTQAVTRAYGESLRIGIGLNSGTVVVGTVGGGGRLEFTLIGDAVNVAKRVEQITKELGDRVLLTDATRSRLRQTRHPLHERGTMAMRGKHEDVRLHALATVGAS